MSRILGRDVEVRGSASARLLPFPSVTFTEVEVMGEGGEPAMTVERFSMDAELAPFLNGEILIFDMRLEQPHAIVEIDEQGRLDWAMRPSVPVDVAQITLEKLTITDGEITLRHAASGRTHTLGDINTEVSARSLIGPWQLDGSFSLDGMMTEVSLTTGTYSEEEGMRVRLRARPAAYPMVLETDGHASIEDGLARYAGQFRIDAKAFGARPVSVEGDRFALSAEEDAVPAHRLTGRFAFDHMKLAVEEFRLETGPVEEPYIANGSAEFDLGPQPSFLIRADGAQVRFPEAGEEGDREGVELSARLSAVRDFLFDLPRPTIPGRIEVRLPAIVAGDTTVRDVRLTAEPSETGWHIGSLAANLPGRTTLEAAGDLSLEDEWRFDGNLLLAVGQPSGFAAWLARDVDEAIRRLPSAGFSADVELARDRQLFSNLELVLGTAKFTGELDRQSAEGMRPTMALQLTGERLDVEGMAAFTSLFIDEGGETRLQDHDISLDLEAGPVSAMGLEAERVDTALRLSEGVLEIDRLAVTGLAGSNISATGQIRGLGTTPTGNLDATIVSTDLGPLAGVLAERFPENWPAVQLARRAAASPAAFKDAQLDIVASAAEEGGAVGAAISATGEVGGGAFTLTARTADLRDSFAATPVNLAVSARNDQASLIYGLIGLPALPMDFAGPAELEISLDGRLDEGAATRLVLRGESMEASFDGEGVIEADALSLSGSARLESANLEPWLITAGVALPGASIGLPVSLEADIDFRDGLMVVSGLSGDAAGSSVAGDLNVAFGEEIPAVSGWVSLDMFDLALVTEMVTGAAALADDGQGWPEEPFHQAMAAPFSTDINLRVAELYAGRAAEMADARFRLKIEDQSVGLSDFSADFAGGRLGGLVELRNDSGTGLLSTQFSLEQADLAQLTELGLDGSLDLTASLTSTGKSIAGMMSSLAGSGTATVQDLVIQGINPDPLPAILAAADRIGAEIDAADTEAFAPEIVRDGAFTAGKLEIAYTVANGIVRAPPFTITSGDVVLSGDIRADLGAMTVSAETTVTYDPGEEELVGSEPSVRFAAAGSPPDVEVRLDTAPLAQFLTQRALEREQARVEAMQAVLLEKQRYRREARYYAALEDERRRAVQEARRAAEEEAGRMLEQEARRSEIEAEQQRLEEEERRRQAEEARLRAEEAARAAEEQRLREENERLRSEVEQLLRLQQQQRMMPPPPAPEAVEQAPLASPPPSAAPAEPAPSGPSSSAEPAPERQAQPFEDLPGVSDIFNEENLSIEGLLESR